jgi:hypothetical protein
MHRISIFGRTLSGLLYLLSIPIGGVVGVMEGVAEAKPKYQNVTVGGISYSGWFLADRAPQRTVLGRRTDSVLGLRGFSWSKISTAQDVHLSTSCDVEALPLAQSGDGRTAAWLCLVDGRERTVIRYLDEREEIVGSEVYDVRISSLSEDGMIGVGGASTAMGSRPIIWSRAEGIQFLSCPSTPHPFQDCSLSLVSPDGRTAIGSDIEGNLFRLNLSTGRATFTGHQGTPTAISGNGRVFAAYYQESFIRTIPFLVNENGEYIGLDQSLISGIVRDLNYDGNLAVGLSAFTNDPFTRGFIWTRAHGVVGAADFFGEDFSELRILSVSAVDYAAQHYLLNVYANGSEQTRLVVRDPRNRDYTGDGLVDERDFALFSQLWEDGQLEGDANEDGGVDGADIEWFFSGHSGLKSLK